MEQSRMKRDYIHGTICHTSQNCIKCILQKSITGYDCTHIDVEHLEKFYEINNVIPECKRPGSYCKYCPYYFNCKRLDALHALKSSVEQDKIDTFYDEHQKHIETSTESTNPNIEPVSIEPIMCIGCKHIDSNICSKCCRNKSDLYEI